ncbi:MAG TPA: hypothetical protein VFY71_09695 [Planctomycetota bacterium]|nr:hypothetical protein [Planctomycetota bacterium]
MSPAKRKSAKSGRSATVAARGGKARGKARGSALTKAVKVKGKTPVKAGDHRVKARNGARTGARNGAGVACDLPREELELLLDRDGGRADVLTHVPACHPCTTSLTVIAAQRDAIRHLTAEPGGTAVEYLLERGAKAGERKLADLVYELAKACVEVAHDLERRLRMADHPRTRGVVFSEVRQAAARNTRSNAQALASRLPSESAPGERAVAASVSCLAILRELEGESERFGLTEAVLLIASDRAGEAEKRLHRLVSRPLTPVNRKFALWNLTWALLEQGKYTEVVSVGSDALREVPGDWSINFNLASACAWLRDLSGFERHAAALRKAKAPSERDRSFRDRLLRFEVPNFAEVLGVGPEIVAQSFGLASRADEVRSDEGG